MQICLPCLIEKPVWISKFWFMWQFPAQLTVKFLSSCLAKLSWWSPTQLKTHHCIGHSIVTLHLNNIRRHWCDYLVDLVHSMFLYLRHTTKSISNIWQCFLCLPLIRKFQKYARHSNTTMVFWASCMQFIWQHFLILFALS